MACITLTFGDCAENHVGMEKLGSLADEGFSLKDLIKAKKWFEEKECKVKLLGLHKLLNEEERDKPENEAYVLVVKNAVNAILGKEDGAKELLKEQKGLTPDKKAYMYGRVVDKKARYNLCFSDQSQEPDYEEGKGRVYAFNEVSLLQKIQNELPKFLGKKAHNLKAEGNYYYDVKKTYIGLHGDSERRKVVAVRLGESIPLYYVWFKEGEMISNVVKIESLQHGDLYIMSEKAVGTDWKKKKICTLRHGAGAEKYVLKV